MIFIILLLIVNVSFSQDKGKTAYENGNYNDARLYYENILRSRENDNAAKYGLGVSAYKQNDIDGALSALKETTNTHQTHGPSNGRPHSETVNQLKTISKSHPPPYSKMET